MENNTRKTLQKRLRSLFSPSPIAIGTLAIGTILLALVITTHVNLGETGFFSPIDSTTIPFLHLHHLILSAAILTGLGYMTANNPDINPVSMFMYALIGIGLAVGFLIITGKDPLRGLTTLTMRPIFTALAVAIGLLYFLTLHTKFDWIAVNVLAILIVSPIIALQSVASTPLWILILLLIATAALDYVAVHRSTAMETIATTVFQFRFPAAYMYPTTTTSLTEALDNNLKGLRMLGLGDVAIPGIFIVTLASRSPETLPLTAATALIGYVVAYVVLISNPFDLDMYAGLPFLNTGVLGGYFLSLLFI